MIITLTGADFSTNNINDSVKRYKVTFTCKDSDGGTLSPTSNTRYFSEGSNVTFSSGNVPSIKGYKFQSASPASITNISADTTVTVTYVVSSSSGGGDVKKVTYLYNQRINDNSGEIEDIPSNHADRVTTETILKINKGDSISIKGSNVLFIGYVWSDRYLVDYLGWAKLDSTSSSGNWCTSCTFGDELLIKGTATPVTYPLYVRLVFKEVSDGTLNIDNIASNMTYNVSDFLDFISMESTVGDIKFKTGYSLNDSDGNLKKVGSERTATETFIKVDNGDTVSLSNIKYKMIIYGYSSPNLDGFLGYIDTNPDDSTSTLKNWGNNFTFLSNLNVKGVSTPVSYPMYMRVTFRTADGEDSPTILDEITSSFSCTGTPVVAEV